MPRTGNNDDQKDQLLCQLELRQTQSQLAIESMELRHHALESSLLRLQKLYQNSPVGFITFDQDSRIIQVNDAGVRLLQVVPEAVIGLTMSVVISEKSAARFMEHLRKCRRAGARPVTSEIEMLTGQGRKLSVQMVTSSVALDGNRLFETALIDLTAQKAAAEAVAQSREYAESIVSTIPYPVIVLDRRGHVISANSAFHFAFQTTEHQVIGWPITQMPDVTWLAPDLEHAFEKAFSDGRPIESMIVRAETRRGSRLAFNMNARRLPGQKDAQRELLLIAFEDITRRERAEQERELILNELQESQTRLEVRVKERTQEVGKSYAQLRMLGEQLILAHEQEQRRIARELHDQIGQDLTALKMVLARGKSGRLEDALKTMEEAHALTEEVLQNVRNICSTLRPQVLDDLGLVAGLQWHIKTFAARTGMEIQFHIEKFNEDALSQIVKSAIFRVIQEALTNVSRHAKTNSASVMLTMSNAGIEFSVRDGGDGFDPSEANKTNSTGLSSMRERISLVHGVFEMSSAPGQGTIVRARIPIKPAPTALPSRPINSELNRTTYGKSSKNQSRHRRRSSPRSQGPQVPPQQ